MEAIAQPSSKSGWVNLKDNSNIAAATLFSTQKAAFGLGADDQLVLLKTDIDDLGITHCDYHQEYKGANYSEHSVGGIVKRANGKIVSGLDLDVVPAIAAVAAINLALASVSASTYFWEVPLKEQLIKSLKNDNSATYYPQPELMITRVSDDLEVKSENLILAYKVDVYSMQPFGGKALYIDANTGLVFKESSLILSCNSVSACTLFDGPQTITTNFDNFYGTNVLYNDCPSWGGTEGVLTKRGPGGHFASISNLWTYDCEGPQAHWGATLVGDYFYSTFGRDSWDNNGAQFYQELGIPGIPCTDNAWFEPGGGYVTYCGSGSKTTDWNTSIDIVGHEWAHAIAFAEGLLYSGETGALQEAFSDIWGAMVEFYSPIPGNWLHCDAFWIGDGYLRNLQNPKLKVQESSLAQPDTYGGEHWNSIGWGSPLHIQSGVASHWFYLLSEGSSATDEVNDNGDVFSFTGITKEKAANILYRSMTVYLPDAATYQDARNGSIWAAEDLYGVLSNEWCQTIQAWNAVGVYGTTGLPYDFTVFTAGASATWEPGNNPFGGAGLVSIEEALIIPAGVDITIKNMTIDFGKNAELLVEEGVTGPGGRLTLDGTTLRSDNRGCDLQVMWNGIRVRGLETESQIPLNTTKQGYLKMINSSAIHSAHVGVSLHSHPNSSGGTGGILQAKDSYFVNNVVDVSIYSYHNYFPSGPSVGQEMSNATYFDNCRFSTIGPLKDRALETAYHVFMWDVHGIQFRGNTFDNFTPQFYDLDKRGAGIISYDANYKLIPKCLSPQLPCSNFKANVFENLFYGILAYTMYNPFANITVKGSEFKNIYRGILLSGLDYSSIVSNNFEIADYNPIAGTTFPYDLPYGLYIQGSTGFEVENNSFTHLGSPSENIGTVVNGSGNLYNEIYNNSYTDLKVCELALNDNDGPLMIHDGLEYLCNSFNNSQRDIIVMNGDISEYQGECLVANDKAPAGNLFSHTCSVQHLPDEEFSTNKTTQTIYYNHHDESITSAPDDRTEPECYDDYNTGGRVKAQNCYQGYNLSSSCENRFGIDCDFPCVTGIIKANEDEAAKLKSLIDGGDKQTLLDVITSNASPGKKKNILLDASPYLSNDVLVAMINEYVRALPPGIVKDVVIANSPVEEEVRKAYLNRTPSLPNGIINSLNAAQTGTSARNELEVDISYFVSRRENAVNKLIRLYLDEENIGEAMKNVLKIVKQEARPVGERCKAVAVHTRLGEFTEAALEIHDLHPDGNLDNLCKMLKTANEFAVAEKTVLEVANNAMKEAEVRSISDEIEFKSNFNSKAVLKFVFKEAHPEVIKLPQSLNKMDGSFSMKQDQNENTNISLLTENHIMKNFPNPFSDYTTIEVFVPDDFVNSEILIHNLLGIQIQKYPLDQGYNVVTVLKSELPKEGIYFYSLISKGKIIERQKMILLY